MSIQKSWPVAEAKRERENKPTAPPEAECHRQHLPQSIGIHDGFVLSREGAPGHGESGPR